MRQKRKWGVLLLVIALAALCCTSVFAEEGDPAATSGWGLLSGESLKETFMSLLTGAIGDFFSGIVNTLTDIVDELLLNVLDVVFHAENLSNSLDTTVLSAQTLRNTYYFIYSIACALVTLKFLFKGFQIYVLWRDGDADSSPRDMLVGATEAGVVMATFPWLYERAVDVCKYFANGIMGTLGATSFRVDRTVIAAVMSLASNFFRLLVALIGLLVFFILLFILWIRLIRQGFELLILRLGLPLATLGLIDSDAALFKNYIQVFIKTALTVIIQVTLMALALRMIMSFSFVNVLISIAVMCTALSSPKLMQQFLVPQGGGGGLAQKAYSISMVARAGKMFFH